MPAGEREPAPSEVTAAAAEGLWRRRVGADDCDGDVVSSGLPQGRQLESLSLSTVW